MLIAFAELNVTALNASSIVKPQYKVANAIAVGKQFNVDEPGLKSVAIAISKPLSIIANTIKGKGVSFMENNVEWHHKAPTPEQFEIALKEYE